MAVGRILVATRSYFMCPSLLASAELKSGFLSSKRFIHVSKIHLQRCVQRHCRINLSLACSHASWSCDNHMPLTSTHSHCYSSSSSSPPGNEPGWLKQQWAKLMTTVRAFASGTKALYQDMKKMRTIQSKDGVQKMVLGQPPRDPKTGQVDFPLTREELLFTVKTKKDLLKMLPTVFLFCIPFFGYFVPLIAFMYPHHLLSSHFLTDEQKDKLMASTHQKVLAKTEVISDILKKEGATEQMEFLYEASDMFASGQVSDGVIQPRRGSGSLKTANVNVMEAVVDMWEVRSWLALVSGGSQRRKLAKHLSYIYTSDWLMKLEGGVDALPPEALSELCLERRLNVNLKSTDDMRKKLDVWMKITTTFEAGCPEFVMAHLPATQYLQKTIL